VKFNPTGAPVYAICFVGVAAVGIAADSAGNAYVSGSALIKLSPTGAVVYSVGLGQPLNNVAVDANGNAYVVASVNGAISDIAVAKVNAAGTALLYSVSFGGSSVDNPFDIAIDGNGDAYVVGWTQSADFPLSHAIQTSLRGIQDAFVAKLDPTGSLLLYSTYLGGPAIDAGTGIALDNAGNAYVGGIVAAPSNGIEGFPVTSGAARVVQPGGAQDAWVTKLNASGARVYGTYVGGSGFDNLLDLAVDPTTGAAVLTGATSSTNFPNTTGVPLAGPSDAYVVQLNPAGSAFSFARYLGGTAGEQGIGVATDSSGHVYLSGYTDSPTFPTGGAPNHGGRDAYVVKLNP
jgi:hypothetical protein